VRVFIGITAPVLGAVAQYAARDPKALALGGHVRARGDVAAIQRCIRDYAALSRWLKAGAITFPRQAFMTERWL